MTSTIEELYQARMDALTPSQRIERSAAMFAWTRDMIARQIQAERGPMSQERLKWEVALRVYGADGRVRAMIERKLADVSD